jgi:hypothetical protein
VLCECHTCKVHYAVVNVEKLRVRPKCYFCRTHRRAPAVSCRLCGNAYLDQCLTKPYGNDRSSFACAACELSVKNPSKSTTWAPSSEIVKISVKDYLEQNGIATLSDSGASVFRHRTLYKACSDYDNDQIGRLIDSFFESGYLSAKMAHHVNGKLVIDRENVLREIRARAEVGERERLLCGVCFETLPKAALHPVCGKPRRCGVLACRSCLDAWYGASLPGNVCLPAHISCPFCKGPPSAKTLVRHNRALCLLRGVASKAFLPSLDPASIHAWCESCNNLRPVAERACADVNDEIGNAMRRLTRFR